MIRNTFRAAVTGAANQMRNLHNQIAPKPPTTWSDEEKVQRYLKFHRGRPRRLIRFAARNAPPGANVLAEAQRYEQAMEELVRRMNNG